MLGGVLIFMGLDFAWACVAIVLGIVIGLLLVGFHAIQGPRLGVPQMIQSRGQFGFYGAVLVFAASIVLDFGFLAAQLVIQADAMNLLVGSVTVPEWIAILDGAGGRPHDLRLRLDPPLAAVDDRAPRGHLRGRSSSRRSIRGAPSGALAGTQPAAFALFMGATGLFVIAMVSWAPYVSDYSRYLPENVSQARTSGRCSSAARSRRRSARSSART